MAEEIIKLRGQINEKQREQYFKKTERTGSVK